MITQKANGFFSGINTQLLYIFMLITVILGTSLSQTQFQWTIGGDGADNARSIIQTTDGGYVMAGYSTSFGAGNNDYYIVKLDASDNIQWSRTIGGANDDRLQSMIQTSDGGFALVGYSNSFGAGNYDLYIVKLDASGTLQWNKTIGGPNIDAAFSIIQISAGGFVVAGETTSFGAGNYDICIVKLDGTGTLEWSRTVGGTGVDAAYSITRTTDGGFAVAGETSSFGADSSNFYIVKFDASGMVQWSRTVGGTANDFAQSIEQTTDGGYAVAGYTRSFGAGDYDFYIVKLDGSGTLQWSKTIGGTLIDYAGSIIQTSDGGYAVTGRTYSFGFGNTDFYITKLDGYGTLQWSRTVGGTGFDNPWSIEQTTDGSYEAAGFTNSFGVGGDMYIVKLNASGNTCGTNSSSPPSISGTGGTLFSVTSIVNNITPTVINPTSATGTGGTLTINCILLGIEPASNAIPGGFGLYQNYPNPFNPSTKIKFALPNSSFTKLVIYDLLGKEMETLVNEQLQVGTYEIVWDASNFPSGVYFYKLISGNYAETKKMLLVK